VTDKGKKLVIVGDSAFAQIAAEYFQVDSDFEVVGFSVERAFLSAQEICGLPVVPFEELERHYSPEDHHVYVAITYTKMNRVRTRLAEDAKHRGFSLASYVSSRAFVWRNVELAEHCFVFEDNVIQPFVEIQSNVVLWSGNHIGHHSIVRKNCFISSHAVISGFCDIGENSFIGVNAAVGHNVKLGVDNWLGPNVTVTKDTADGVIVSDSQSRIAKVSSLKFFDL
jgi:sugar O-acyltransferase (sialic acid O-acetyltransferase NeuD family)